MYEKFSINLPKILAEFRKCGIWNPKFFVTSFQVRNL